MLGKLRSTRWKTAKEKLTKEEVRSPSGDWYEESRNTGFANGAKTAGQESSLGSEGTICSESKARSWAGQKRKE